MSNTALNITGIALVVLLVPFCGIKSNLKFDWAKLPNMKESKIKEMIAISIFVT